MNKNIYCGRLTRDPEITYYGEGEEKNVVAKFTLAVDRKYVKSGKKESAEGESKEKRVTADFIPCVVFGNLAKVAEGYFKKGTKILMTGQLQNNNYKKENGEMVYSFRVLMEDFEFVEKKQDESGQVQNEEKFMDIPEGELDGLPFN